MGSQGVIWYTGQFANKLGRLDPKTGAIKEYRLPDKSGPHGLTADKDGNLWVADNGLKDGKGQQVFKLSPDGKVLMTLGRAGVAGPGPDTFDQPTEVAIAPNGDIFVGDGHGNQPTNNARIVKFDKTGKFIKAWGKKGTGRGGFEHGRRRRFGRPGQRIRRRIPHGFEEIRQEAGVREKGLDQ